MPAPRPHGNALTVVLSNKDKKQVLSTTNTGVSSAPTVTQREGKASLYHQDWTRKGNSFHQRPSYVGHPG